MQAKTLSSDIPPETSVPRSEIRVGHYRENVLEGLRASAPLATEAARDTFVFDDAPWRPDLPVGSAPPQPGHPPVALAEAEVAEPVQNGIAWDVAPIFEGRQEIGPASDLLQSALGNRIDGAEFVGTRRDDILTASEGDDVIVGGRGNDVMTGGAGTDVFVFSQSGTGRDRITDFTTDDVLYFGAETIFDISEIEVTQIGGDTVLNWHRGASELVLEDFAPADLAADQFILAAL